MTSRGGENSLNNDALWSVPVIVIVLLCVGFAFQGTAALSLHYAFDGGFADSSPSNNQGTPLGNAGVATNTAQVAVGTGALLLDGGDSSYVALSNALTFAAGSPWSAAFWARRGETGGGKGMVMGKINTTADFIWLNDSVAGLRFRSSSAADADFKAPKDLNPHHYALAAAGDGTLSFYVDGVLATNAAVANTSFKIDSVGQAYNTNSLHYGFKGVLDDVRVYTHAVDAATVAELFELGRPILLHYAFDGDFTDSSPSGNDGTTNGAAALTTSPAQVTLGAGALSLDGAGSSYVALSNAVTFASGNAWSATFWARRGAAGDKGMVMGSRFNSNDFIWLNDSYQGLRFRSSNNTLTLDFTAPKDLNLHHYALVAVGNNTMSLYIDGVLSTNKPASNTSLLVDTIGKAHTSTTYDFKGVLDDVRLYAYAVDAAVVSALFREGRPEVLHYAFDGDFADSSPSLNHGVASGGAAVTADSAQVAVGSGALSLDGADSSYVALSNAITFASGTLWSTAFWARRGEVGSSKGMVLGCRTNANDFIWLNDSFTGLRFRSSTGATLDYTVPKDRNTHHYALAAEGNGTLSLYVDGVLSANKAIANTSFVIDTIGQAYTASSHYGFQGVLDGMHVYAYALAAANVSALYQQGNVEPPPPPVTVTRVHVFLQGGQSNSEGRADPAGLPTAPVNLQGYQADVDFYYGGSLGTLHPATPGTPIVTFGPEITCGRRLVDRMKPDVSNRVAIIKYSVGGTTLYSDWKAGGDATTAGDGPRYVSFQQAVSNGWAALKAAYPAAQLSLEGMIWMQGESDVTTASAAYYSNLTNFIADVRLTLDSPRLPFIIGRLSSAQTGAGSVTLLNVVRQAMTDVASADPWTGLVDTDSFHLKTDYLHFDAAGQQALGTAFAEQLLFLRGLSGLFTPDEVAAGATEPGADPDHDGMNNWNESLAGTDPSEPSSVLAITAAAAGSGPQYVVRWPSVAGRVYAVERSTNLLEGAFVPMATNLPAIPPVNVYTDTVPASASLFYRVRADRQP